MSLSTTCINRPVFATVLSIVLIIFGWLGYSRLSVRELPDVEFPIVTIVSELRGANPEIVEEEVTDLIEEEISTIEGIKHITSVSQEGSSNVTVEFELERDINIAAQDIRDKVARIRQQLPDDMDEPTIEKLDLDAQAIIWLALQGENYSQTELTYHADKYLKEQLQKVPGVGSIMLGGEKRFALRIWLDSERLTARKLTVDDVVQALRDNNVELPSGRIEGLWREFSVKTEGELETVEAFNDLIVAYHEGAPIRLREVGFAEEGVENERTLARFRGEPTVGLGIMKQSDANTLDVANGVKGKLEKLRAGLPDGMKLSVAYDSSEFIENSINEVKETLLIAGLLVVVVIFFFLRNIRSTIIPGFAMPISIISTFAAMYFLGFTLNNFTLLALVLSIGVVVDDAIVMLENIYRHMEKGKARKEAAFVGSGQITFAVIATSLSLVAVFVPVAFMKGQIGRFFYEFGITVSVAVMISTFVALTLTPMLCSLFLKVPTRHTLLFNIFEGGYQFLENNYKRILKAAVRLRWLVVILGFATLFVSAALFGKIGKEFVPGEDRGDFMILMEAPEGSTLEYTDKYLSEVETILNERKDIEGFFSALALAMAGSTGPNKGLCFVRLARDPARAHQDSIIAEIRDRLVKVPGLDAFVITFNPLSHGSDAKTFEYVLQHPDIEKLKKYNEVFLEELRKNPAFIDVDSDLELNKPEIKVNVDRDRAAALKVSIREIADTLNTYLGGNDFSKFKARGERYDVILQLLRKDRLTPDILDRIYVRSSAGQLIKLSNVIDYSEGVGPSEINRYDRVRAVTVSANLNGITLGEAIKTAENFRRESLPQGFTATVKGQAEEMEESFTSLLLAFVLAIVMVYLILAAQFESFIHPITVMAALPLSAIGALGSLYLFDMTVNIYSIIGIIMLIGLVTKNSILLVDFTNALKAKGLDLVEAVSEAGRVRFRPILMTAVSTVFGILPIALGLGAGAEGRRPMGMAVVGGMIASTLLTLFVVPAFYTIVEDFSLFCQRILKKEGEI